MAGSPAPQQHQQRPRSLPSAQLCQKRYHQNRVGLIHAMQTSGPRRDCHSPSQMDMRLQPLVTQPPPIPHAAAALEVLPVGPGLRLLWLLLPPGWPSPASQQRYSRGMTPLVTYKPYISTPVCSHLPAHSALVGTAWLQHACTHWNCNGTIRHKMRAHGLYTHRPCCPLLLTISLCSRMRVCGHHGRFSSPFSST